MKNIRLFHKTFDYEKEKMELKYPTVSLDKEGKKVHYVRREKPNRIIATYSVTEDQVGQNIALAYNLENCSDIILDGKSLNTPISVNSGVVTPTSYGIYSSMTFTDDSWVVSPAQSWEITFDKPLQAGDMIGLSLFIPEYNGGENFFIPYEEVVSEGIFIPIEPNNTQKFTCLYTTAIVRVDCNILMYAFTPIDENGTVTEDNFIGATHECEGGGIPASVIVKPTEATTHIIEYRISKGDITKDVVTNICENATSVDLSSFDTSNITDMSGMFQGCSGLTSLDLSSFDTSNITDMRSMFVACESLTSLDLSNFDTSKVTNMRSMFSGCRSLTSVTFGDKFDTSKVTNMEYMFNSCNDLTSIDLSSFDTSNVTSMDGMFNGCSSLSSLDLSNFDTSKVTNIGWMFGYCYGLTSVTFGDNFGSACTNMEYMFYCCSGLTSLDVSNFNTSNVRGMSCMFNGCGGLTSLDLSNFNTSKVTYMGSMFYNCSNLTSITFGSQADVGKATSYDDNNGMFYKISTTGTLYYPSAYAGSWYNLLVRDQSSTHFPSTWTAVPIDYENGETVPTV